MRASHALSDRAPPGEIRLKVFLLLGIYIAASFLNEVFLKKNSNVLRGGKTDQPVFILITAVTACLFFTLESGFSIRINGITWLYAAAYAVIVLVALLVMLIIYRYASIPTVSVIKNTLTLLVTSAVGSALFDEEFSWMTGLRIVLLILASGLIYYAQCREMQGGDDADRAAAAAGQRKKRTVFLILMAVLVLDICATTLLTKSFALREDVSDSASYCFATNVFLFGMGAVWLLIVGWGKRGEIAHGLRRLRPKHYLSIAMQTISSNVVSLVSIPLTAMLAVASYSAYTSAIGIIAATLASLCFREKQNRYSVAAILIAIVSFLIGAI